MENGDLDFGAQKLSSNNGDVLFNCSKHEHQLYIPNEIGPDSICKQLEPRVLSIEATDLMDEQLNCALPESKSSDEVDGVFANANESRSKSSSSTSSGIHRDNGILPLEGNELSPDSCPDFLQQPGNKNVVLVCPDYVVYQGRYSTEAVLFFSTKSMKLKYSATDGDQGMSIFEWKIEDIVDIRSQWSHKLKMALVKLHLMMKGAEELLVEELQFAVADVNWPEKQEEIMSLGERYKALWNVEANVETERDEHDLSGTNGESNWRKFYFPNFVDFYDEVIYPKGELDAVSISKRDVDLLQPDIFVNDTIIDFYIKYLKNQMPLEKRSRFHFFNSFFFRKLIDLDKDSPSSFEGKAAFQRVRKWTRKVNVFEKDYVFIPVNYGYHWSLILICHPGEITKFEDENMEKSHKVPCILHMDSMKGSHTVLKEIVQSYLWEEWNERNKGTSEDISPKFFNLRFVSLELPQQPNTYDCGLFLLHYVECFLEQAPINFCLSKITHYSKFLNLDWFQPEEPCLKRAYIQRLISKIVEEENSQTACSSLPCALDCHANNNASQNNLECIPSKNVSSGNLSGSQSSEGIEITLLQTSASQYDGDSGLVLREFLEAGTTAGQPIDGQYQTLDQAAAFGAMGHMEDDAEACVQFVCTRSIINPDSVFPCLSNDLGVNTHNAEREHFEKYPKTSIDGSCYFSEVDIQESNSSEKNIIEEKTYVSRSSLVEKSLSAANQMLDVAEFESCDHILDSSGTADNDLKTFKLSGLTSQQPCNAQENGHVTCVDINVVSMTSTPVTDGQQCSETISQDLVSETDGVLNFERIAKDSIGNGLVSESAAQNFILGPVSQDLILESVSQVPEVSPDLVSETEGVLDLERIGKDSFGNIFLSASVSHDLVSESVSQDFAEPVSQDLVSEPVSQHLVSEPVSQDLIPELVSQDMVPESISQDMVSESVWQDLTPKPVSQDLFPEPVSQDLVSETNGLLDLKIGKDTFGKDLVSESFSQDLVPETNGLDLVSETDGQLVAKRPSDDLSPELNEQQSAKKPRVDC